MKDRPSIRLRVGRSIVTAAAAIALALTLFVAQFTHGYNPISYVEQRPAWAPLIIAGYVGTLWFAFVAWSILDVLLLRRQLPIATNKGVLSFLNPLLWSLKIHEIAEIEPSSITILGISSRAVRFVLRNGREKWLSTGLLAGGNEEIARYLKTHLSSERMGTDVRPA
jgi:hypothetical protein